jgi:glycosidase
VPAPADARRVEQAVVYGVVPERFGPRGLADVVDRLPALAALGVDTLWLSPLHPGPAGDFGYAVTDHFGVRASIGGPGQLTRLVEQAHRLGLRVLLDLVPSHTSDRHPYFVSATRLGAASPHHRYYEHDGAGRPTHYFDWRHLPNLDYAQPEVRRFVTEAFLHWVREHDVDGFRVDAAWAVRRRAPDFFPGLVKELRRLRPDLLLIAEASAIDPYYAAAGFDAAYDWTLTPGSWAWQEVWDSPTQRAACLRRALARPPGPVRVLRFLNNNDTGARFIARHGPGLLRAATVLLFTLPGLPALYSGDEVGASYLPYGPAGAIRWHEDPNGLQALHRQLIQLRRGLPALRSAELTLLPVHPAAEDPAVADRVLAYLRPAPAPGEAPALVVLNLSDQPAAIQLELPRALPPAGRLVDRLGDGDRLPGPVRPDVQGRLHLELPAHGTRLLTPTRG